MNVPEGLRYSSDHEWVKTEDEIGRVGITDYAQDALGDVVYVDLPPVGTVVAGGSSLGEVESTKSVSDLFAPISGEIVAVNEELVAEPERLNTDPYGDGWICLIAMSNPSELDRLLDAVAYQELIVG